MKSADSFQTTALSFLVVGEPKSGKSDIGLAFPSVGVIDWDLNLSAAVRRARHVDPKFSFQYTQPAIRDDGTERPMDERWEQCIKETKTLIADPSIKSIMIDGLGMMCEAITSFILKANVAAGTSKLKTVDAAGKSIPKMEIQHYDDLQRILRQYIMWVRSSGKFFIVTSHQTGDKDDVTGVIRYVLAIPGKSKDTLGGCFTDVVAAMATPSGLNKVKYEIRTKPTGFHVALGASFPIEGAIDVTDKSPQEIWKILEPKITAK